MVIGGCHKVGGSGEVGSLHHNYSLSDMADVVQPLCAIEDSFTSTNNARDEICPHRDTWTIIDHNGNVQYKIPACIKGGQTSPVA